jgi:hypothetical protein
MCSFTSGQNCATNSRWPHVLMVRRVCDLIDVNEWLKEKICLLRSA